MQRFAPLAPIQPFEFGWGMRPDPRRDASPDVRHLRSPMLVSPTLPAAPVPPFGMVGLVALPTVPAFAQHPPPVVPVAAAQTVPVVAAAASQSVPAAIAVPVSAVSTPPPPMGRIEPVASGVSCSVGAHQPPLLHLGAVSSPPQPPRASRSTQRIATSPARGSAAELEPLAAAPAPPPSLPSLDTAVDEWQDRRPTDPFFYPTTISPLTARGYGAAERGTPRTRRPCADGAAFSPAREDSAPHHVSPLAFSSLAAKIDDFRLHEPHNDDLARNIQALEHAKSLAVVQSAQALHKIRTRQEQLRREADKAMQRSKVMQADLLPGTPRGPPPGAGEEAASPASPQPQLAPSQPPPTALDGGRLAVPFHERRSLGSPGRASAALAEPPLWSQEAWLSPAPAPGRGLWEAADAAGSQQAPDDVAGGGAGGGASGASSAPRPLGSSVAAVAASAVATAADEALQPAPWLAPASKAQQVADLAPAPLPAADVPSTDVAAMANRILTAHQTPGHGGAAATLPNGQPYVDALGNPLGPAYMPELPNIKDMLWRGEEEEGARLQDDLGAMPDLRGSSEWVAERPGRLSEAPPEPQLPQQPASARNPVAHERASVAVVHERAPASARASTGGSSAPERAERRGQQPGGGGGGGQAASAAGAPPALGPAGDAADAAAGGAAATPPSTPAMAEGGRTSRGRQEAGESPGASRGGRRRSGDDAAKAQHADAGQPAQLSEQAQAELDECLDTIKWCASSVTKESLQDVLKSNKPAPVVKDVLEAVALLVGQTETRWDKLKRLVGGAGFLEKVQRLNFKENVSLQQFRKLRERLGNPDFDEELIKTVCVPVVPLAMWCRAIGVHLSKTKFRGGPEIRPVASAGAADPAPQGERRPSASGAQMVFDPDIQGMDSEELRRVRDLTISRPAVGKITFHGETDCTGLDFERIVRLEIGEVLVYPESGMKPPIGTGLNKPATVTMYQCWPPSSSRLLQDPRGQERYRRKIQQMTEEKQATFIDYDCATGVWKFSVDHF